MCNNSPESGSPENEWRWGRWPGATRAAVGITAPRRRSHRIPGPRARTAATSSSPLASGYPPLISPCWLVFSVHPNFSGGLHQSSTCMNQGPLSKACGVMKMSAGACQQRWDSGARVTPGIPGHTTSPSCPLPPHGAGRWSMRVHART